MRVCEFHGPLVFPTASLVGFLQVVRLKMTPAVIVNLATNYLLYVAVLFICNCNWLYSVISIILTTLSTLLLLFLYMNIGDYQTAIQIILIGSFIGYACY